MDETEVEEIVDEVMDEVDDQTDHRIVNSEDAIEILEGIAGRCQAMADALKEQLGIS